MGRSGYMKRQYFFVPPNKCMYNRPIFNLKAQMENYMQAFKNLKADRLHPRNCLPMSTDYRHTYKHLRSDIQTDRWMDATKYIIFPLCGRYRLLHPSRVLKVPIKIKLYVS